MDERSHEWQYKVIHGNFSTRQAIEAMLDEQSQWGWQLSEVMNAYQIRLGRSNQTALKDVAREGNPYATTSRTHIRTLVLVLILVMVPLFLLVILAFVRLDANRAQVAMPVPKLEAPPLVDHSETIAQPAQTRKELRVRIN